MAILVDRIPGHLPGHYGSQGTFHTQQAVAYAHRLWGA